MKKLLSIILASLVLLSSASFGGYMGIDLPKLNAGAATDIEIIGYDRTVTSVVNPTKINNKEEQWTSNEINYNYSNPCSHINTTNYDAVAENCTEYGYTAGVYCDDCETWISGHEVIKNHHIDKDGDKICDTCKNAIAIIAQGNCGNEGDGSNAKYVLYDDGTLVISGMGEMRDSPEYLSNSSNIISIKIEYGITSTGSCAFYECSAIESVELPESLGAIGYSAFSSCVGLRSIDIPESVEFIDVAAFFNCCTLESIKIPDLVTAIEDETFLHCTMLSEIELPDSISYIGEYAFAHCQALESIVIPDTLTSICDYAFHDCNSLATVNYTGTQEQWSEISIGDSNNYLASAIINYNCAACSHINTTNYDAIAENCTSDGYTEGVYCDDCETWISGHEVIEKHHILDDVAAKDADCTEDGYKAYKKSTKCDYTESYEEINALGHMIVVVPGKAATCAEKGLSDGKKCSVCGEVTLKQVETPTIDHDYTEVITKPTCTKDGFTIRTCENCGHMVKDDEVPAKGHTPSDWIVETAAKVGVKGIEIKICTICEEKLVEREIPALKEEPTTEAPTTKTPTIDAPTTEAPTTEAPTTEAPTTEAPTTEPPTTEAPTTEAPTTEEPTTEPSYMLGDINGDGNVTATDARIILRISAKLEKLEDQKVTIFAAADVNGDGKITATDARKILRVSARLESF